jgi:hypothetical protein
MSLLVLGINHQTAPVGLRERVAFGADALPRALATLRGMPSVREVALLSTCNRTELYALADDEGAALAIGWPRIPATPATCTPTCIAITTPTRCAICSASPPGWIRWCSANRRSSAR